MRVMVTVAVDTGDGKWHEKTLTMSGDPDWLGRRWREYFPVHLERAIDQAQKPEPEPVEPEPDEDDE